mmetsp:Transcript_21972/g.65200  ORF Transcript_21972/g.65200 Transcript_21972/m.65200 type:complete len:237 (-) Transcript_21972:1082-1792(-)
MASLMPCSSPTLMADCNAASACAFAAAGASRCSRSARSAAASSSSSWRSARSAWSCCALARSAWSCGSGVTGAAHEGGASIPSSSSWRRPSSSPRTALEKIASSSEASRAAASVLMAISARVSRRLTAASSLARTSLSCSAATATSRATASSRATAASLASVLLVLVPPSSVESSTVDPSPPSDPRGTLCPSPPSVAAAADVTSVSAACRKACLKGTREASGAHTKACHSCPLRPP